MQKAQGLVNHVNVLKAQEEEMAHWAEMWERSQNGEDIADTGTIKAYKVSNPIIRPMRISESSNVVLPFKEPAGIYTLTDGSISRHIDLGSGFFSSCYQWIYEQHDKPGVS